MKFQSLGCAIFAFAGLLSGCAPNSKTELNKNTVSYWAKLDRYNGQNLNGVNLNGHTYLDNGVNFNGVNLNGVNLNGVNLNGVNLNGSDLRGTPNGTSTEIGGTDLINYRIEGVLSNETTIPMVIENVVVDSMDPTVPHLYYISLAEVDEENNIIETIPACSDEENNPVPAVLLNGTWDDNTGNKSTGGSVVTLACVNAAIGKCVAWGYHPWETKIIYPGTPPSTPLTNCTGANTGLCQEVSMEAAHQACTRMVRADYCGEGKAHTYNGTSINIWDSFDIQSHGSPGSSYYSEAEWTPSGARCIRKTRWTNAGGYGFSPGDWTHINTVCPERVAGTVESRYDQACDSMGQCAGSTVACINNQYCDCNVVGCATGWSCNTGSGHCEEACDGGNAYLFSTSSSFEPSVGYSVSLTNSNHRLERKILRNESE